MNEARLHSQVYFQLLKELDEVEDRRAPKETRTVIDVQPECRHFSICDTFETELTHRDCTLFTMRMPPACPPVVF